MQIKNNTEEITTNHNPTAECTQQASTWCRLCSETQTLWRGSAGELDHCGETQSELDKFSSLTVFVKVELYRLIHAWNSVPHLLTPTFRGRCHFVALWSATAFPAAERHGGLFSSSSAID